MSTKDWLRRGYYIDTEITSLMRARDKLWSDCTRVTPAPPQDIRVQSAPRPREELLVKLAELNAEIDARIDRLVDTKREIAAAIALVSDGLLRTILTERYVNLCSWEDVAAVLGYDYRWVTRLHGRALEAVAPYIPAGQTRPIKPL